MATKESKSTSKEKASSAEQRADSAAAVVSAKLSGPLAPLEKSLDNVFGEKAAYKLPKNAKDVLVKIAPWLTLASGVLGILSAISLWRAAHYVNEWVDYANQISASFGGPTQANKLGLFFWLSLASLLLFSVLAFLAFPGLKNRKKTGWNLVFYSALASLVLSVVSLFYEGGGFGSFLMTGLASALGLYLLFQVRSYYK